MFAASKTDSASTGGYQISRSLRFNSADSAYLNRTPASAGNRRTWTWSAWVKRGSGFGDRQNVFGAATSDFNTDTHIELYEANQLRLVDYVSATNMELVTTQVFRDPSAWYHFVVAVDTTQATSSNRAKIYVNGSQVTSFTTATYPSQNYDTQINNTISHGVGRAGAFNGQYFNGYQTDVYLIDGQALTPSSFGYTNPATGVWSPLAFVGTYGTNGFYLNFSDNSNTTAATLGKDYSGNGNNWTPNNFSVTAGAGNDSLVDSPTSYGTDTGVGGTVRGNYATLNPLDKSQYVTAPVNGNLDVLNAGNFVEDRFVGTIGVSSSKWYFETTITGTYANCQIGIHDANSVASTNTMVRTYLPNGQKMSGTTATSYGNSFTTGDVLGVAIDMDSGKIWFSKNGTFQASGDPVAGTNAAFTDLSGSITPFAVDYAQTSSGTSGHNLNFGQRPFAYTAPSGYKALCTQNLPTPTIGATTATQAGKFFNPVLYTGNGSTQSVTGVGFQPDWTWIKIRSAVADHALYDAVRGVQKQLETNTSTAETTETTGLTAFGSDGFTVGSLAQANGSGSSYVAWNWKANGAGSSNTAGSITSTASASTTSGFSVVTYTGTGANATVGHGLGVAPSFIIVKRRDDGSSWNCYHISLGASQYIQVDGTAGAATNTGVWNNTAPTSTVFSIGTAFAGVNASGSTHVAYCFAPVSGYSAFGSYTGNGSADGPFIYCGFRPKYILFKTTAAINQPWGVADTTRSPYNLTNLNISPTYDTTENSGYAKMDILSNGFKLREDSVFINGSGSGYIFMALAENPFKYSLAR